MKKNSFEKWDVHHHIIPDFYVEELEKIGINKIFGMKQPKWTEVKQSRMMKKHNISRIFMSISTPGVYFNGDNFSRRLARRCNEYIANKIEKDPANFGGFASVPLPDVEGAIREMEYSLDTLNLDGISLLSNVKGNYLGSREYELFFEELNRRKAVVFIHPTAPGGKMEHSLLNYMYLFMLDTTRTMIDFIRSGYHRRFPEIRFILAHGGGVLPAIYPSLVSKLEKESPGIEEELENWKRQIYLDTARIAYHNTMETAADFIGINHLLFGSDYIWAKNNYAYWIKLISNLNIDKSYIQDIFRNNSERALDSNRVEANKKTVNIPVEESFNNSDNKNIEYHYHFITEETADYIGGIDSSISIDKDRLCNINRIKQYKANKNYEKIMLTMDIPGIWKLTSSEINLITSKYNSDIAENIKEEKGIEAFGAINVGDPEYALREIDHCINDLNLKGISIYLNGYQTALEDIFDIRVMEKLSNLDMPVLVHPEDSTGIPIINENYLDAVYFTAKMLYLDNYQDLNDTEYILTHTGGIVPFMAQNIGLLYYLQLHKQKYLKFIFDWLITGNLKGYELLKNIDIAD